jgi:hypothetical protein
LLPAGNACARSETNLHPKLAKKGRVNLLSSAWFVYASTRGFHGRISYSLVHLFLCPSACGICAVRPVNAIAPAKQAKIRMEAEMMVIVEQRVHGAPKPWEFVAKGLSGEVLRSGIKWCM